MKKKNGLFKSIFNIGKSIIQGVTSAPKNVVVGVISGAIQGLKKENEQNQATETNGEGNHDLWRWVGFAAILILCLALIFGWIDAATFNQLLPVIQDL